MPEEQKKEIQILVNPSVQTLFADHLVVLKRTDDLVGLRVIAELPEGWTEQARLMVPKERLIRFVDVICAQIDYYPSKTAKNSSRSP